MRHWFWQTQPLPNSAMSLESLAPVSAETIPTSDSDVESVSIERAQRDPSAFAPLYDAHYAAVLSFLYRRCLNISLAEEMTSRTFFNALRALPRYTHRNRFRYWLYRIALNELRSHWRVAWRSVPLAEGDAKSEALSRIYFEHQDQSRAETTERMERFKKVSVLLDALPARYRVPLSLRYYEGLSGAEIAAVLDKSEGTVKSLLHRGLKQIRTQWERQ